MPKKLYGVTEFAKEMKTTRQAIHRDYKRGKLPAPATFAGTRPFWTKEQIEEYKKQVGV